jgi:hypothetical protein
MQVDPVKTVEFIDKFQHGLNVTDVRDPAYYLKTRVFERSTASKLPQIYVDALAIKAFNHYLTGNPLKMLIWKKEGGEAFPSVHNWLPYGYGKTVMESVQRLMIKSYRVSGVSGTSAGAALAVGAD